VSYATAAVATARRVVETILSDRIEVWRATTTVNEGDMAEYLRREKRVYAGRGLVQQASNTRTPVQELQLAGAVQRYVVKAPLTLTIQAGDRVKVVSCADKRLNGSWLKMAAPMRQSFAVVGRYLGFLEGVPGSA